MLERAKWESLRAEFYADESAALDEKAEAVVGELLAAKREGSAEDGQRSELLRLLGAAVYGRVARLSEGVLRGLLDLAHSLAYEAQLEGVERRRLAQLLHILIGGGRLSRGDAETALADLLHSAHSAELSDDRETRLHLAVTLTCLHSLTTVLPMSALAPHLPSLIGLVRSLVWFGLPGAPAPQLLQTRPSPHLLTQPVQSGPVLNGLVKPQRKRRPHKHVREAGKKAQLDSSLNTSAATASSEESSFLSSSDERRTRQADRQTRPKRGEVDDQTIRRGSSRLLASLAWKWQGLGPGGKGRSVRGGGRGDVEEGSGELEHYWLDLFPDREPSAFSSPAASLAHLVLREPVAGLRLEAAKAVLAWTQAAGRTVGSAVGGGGASFASRAVALGGSLADTQQSLLLALASEPDPDAAAQETKALNALLALLPFRRLAWPLPRRHAAFTAIVARLDREDERLKTPNSTAPMLTCLGTLAARGDGADWAEELPRVWALSRRYARPPHRLPVRLEALTLSVKLLYSTTAAKGAPIDMEDAMSAVVETAREAIPNTSSPSDFDFFAIRLFRSLLHFAGEDSEGLWELGLKETALRRVTEFAGLRKPLRAEVAQTLSLAPPSVLAREAELMRASLGSLGEALLLGLPPAVGLSLHLLQWSEEGRAELSEGLGRLVGQWAGRGEAMAELRRGLRRQPEWPAVLVAALVKGLASAWTKAEEAERTELLQLALLLVRKPDSAALLPHQLVLEGLQGSAPIASLAAQLLAAFMAHQDLPLPPDIISALCIGLRNSLPSSKATLHLLSAATTIAKLRPEAFGGAELAAVLREMDRGLVGEERVWEAWAWGVSCGGWATEGLTEEEAAGLTGWAEGAGSEELCGLLHRLAQRPNPATDALAALLASTLHLNISQPNLPSSQS